MYKKLNLIIGGLGLVLAMGCTSNTSTKKGSDNNNELPVKHADKPGILNLSNIEKENKIARTNFAHLYLFAASDNPSPFSGNYDQLDTRKHRGVSKMLCRSAEGVIKYIRTGGDEKKVKDIKEHIKTLDKIPQTFKTFIPGLAAYPEYAHSPGTQVHLVNYSKSIYTFLYELVTVGVKGSFSTKALFKNRQGIRKKADGSEVITKHPIETFLPFTGPPAVIATKIYRLHVDTEYVKDIEVSPELTLPAACTTTQKQDVKYKLMGAIDDGNTLYFCWKGKHWYKIDLKGDDLKPQKVDKQEVLNTGKKTSENSNDFITSFSYIYDMSTGSK